MKPSEVMRQAIELLKSEGWVQGKYVDHGTGCMCGVGAMRKVTDYCNPQVRDTKAYQDAYVAYTKDTYRLAGKEPISFNDEPGMTATKVMRMMGVTARRLEKAGR